MPEREQSMRLRLGIFVLGLLVLFVVFVLTIGSRSRIFERRYTLHAFFGTTEVLNVGAPSAWLASPREDQRHIR
jgi:ABC-type transporter Mla subunit MlaD